MTYTPEQMLEEAGQIDEIGYAHPYTSRMLRQGAAAVRAAEAGRVLWETYNNDCNGRGNHALELAMINKAFQVFDAAIKETK